MPGARTRRPAGRSLSGSGPPDPYRITTSFLVADAARVTSRAK
jgi:hypothetical protein